MAKRLLLLDEDQVAFMLEAAATWRRIHAGDMGEKAEHKRVDRFNLVRQLEGKYTKAEREEIGAMALELLE